LVTQINRKELKLSTKSTIKVTWWTKTGEHKEEKMASTKNTQEITLSDDWQIDNDWVERHSVTCYFCGNLVDERDCAPADAYNGKDGGDICQRCQDRVLQDN
tara:strand:+ start:103 stop:408 length:306 start_codon:yes stop_codon:yes gene_type:complete